MTRPLLVACLLFLLPAAASGTTWFDKQVTCPVCATQNTFSAVGSYGSYIYRWPSRYQVLYWPRTDRHVIYSCKSCRLSTLMWDFEKVPKAKHEAIRKALEDSKPDKEYGRYHAIPMSWRLATAEKVYRLLDRDDAFWCDFYRLQGYHLARAKQAKAAQAARKKSLTLARKLAADAKRANQKKLWLLVVGSMEQFTGEHLAALKTLAGARAARFKNPKWKPEREKGYNDYLDQTIDGLLKMARKASESEGKDPGK